MLTCTRLSVVSCALLLMWLPTGFAGEWMPLFDGSTLDGWEGDRTVFRIEEGAITAGSLQQPIARNEFLCTTDSYADFDLVLRFKITGDPAHANAGVQLRSQRIPDHHEMIGYQADIGQHYWGSLYDESRRNQILAQADLDVLMRRIQPDDWNTYRMRCEGRRIRLWINGHPTIDYTESDESLEQSGRIGLQIHGGPPSEIRYRDIYLRDLSDGIPFSIVPINRESAFEAAGILDVNNDRMPDIFCGGWWYQAPDWTRHAVREIPPQDEYYNDFANLPLDVDGDGWIDVVNAAWFSQSVFWLRNPGTVDGEFEETTVGTPGNIETGMLVDINGDGHADMLPNCVNGSAWYEFTPGTSPFWKSHPLPADAEGHGLGAGDVNGDGRVDLVSTTGWLEQGETPDAWTVHGEFRLETSASIPMIVHDVEGDGDADILWGTAHGFGLQWLEQTTDENGSRTWTSHVIDSSWSQAHFLLLQDLDHDDEPELITGKRYRAHNGNDPGSDQPLCVMIYRYQRADASWNRQVVTRGEGVGFGINTHAGDIDGDGDLDLVAPGKSGLFLLVSQLDPPDTLQAGTPGIAP